MSTIVPPQRRALSVRRTSGGSKVEWGGYLDVRKLCEPNAVGKMIRAVGLHKALSDVTPKYNSLFSSSQDGRGFFFLKDGCLFKRRSRFAVVVGKLKSKGGNFVFSAADIDRMELALEPPRLESSLLEASTHVKGQESAGSFHSAFGFENNRFRTDEEDRPGTMLVFLTKKRLKRHSVPVDPRERYSAAESRVIEFKSSSGRQLSLLHNLLTIHMQQKNKESMTSMRDLSFTDTTSVSLSNNDEPFTMIRSRESWSAVHQASTDFHGVRPTLDGDRHNFGKMSLSDSWVGSNTEAPALVTRLLGA